MTAERDFAVVVLGATGVTGCRAVSYLKERGPEVGARWAIAGRDTTRLEKLVDDWPDDRRPELVRTDVTDDAAVAELAGRTQVVVNFAGPFARLAPGVIAACVDAGTHYLDVTGELGFVARMIEQHHERARERGVRIVQVAGFEALPFDVLTRLGIERFTADHGAHPESVDLVVTMSPPPGRPHPSDGVSGGTFDSLREGLRTGDMRQLGDPTLLLGGLRDPAEVRRTSPIGLGPRRDADDSVISPMIPSPDLNPPVIQRTLALEDLPPIRYREGVALSGVVGPRPAQLAVAGALAALNQGFRLLSSSPDTVRRAGATVYGALIPRSRSGPREDRMERWRWAIEGTVRGAGGAESQVRVDAVGHPGYLTTSRMTAEAGLLLADADADLPDAGGCLTPAAALGTAELGRFDAAGLSFAGAARASRSEAARAS